MHTAAGAQARLPIRSDMDLVWVRQHVRQAAAQLGFGLVDQTKLVTAASELARNTLVYGGGGTMETEPVSEGGTQGLRLTFSDEGRASRTWTRPSATGSPRAADWAWVWAGPGAWCTTSPSRAVRARAPPCGSPPGWAGPPAP